MEGPLVLVHRVRTHGGWPRWQCGAFALCSSFMIDNRLWFYRLSLSSNIS